MGLFFFPCAQFFEGFRNLPIFSLVEPFWIKKKIFNFFEQRAEKLCIFAPLFEKQQKFLK